MELQYEPSLQPKSSFHGVITWALRLAWALDAIVTQIQTLQGMVAADRLAQRLST